MGAKSKELEELEAQIYMLQNKMKSAKSHLASIEFMRQMEELKKKKEKIEKEGEGWIIS